MKTFATLSIAALAALALVPAASAGTALSELGAAAGNDTAPIAKQFMEMQEMPQAPAVVGIPRNAKDVLDGCEGMNAKPFMAWNVKQAALIVQTCLNHAYSQDKEFARRSYTVTASVGRFGVRACPESRPGAMACQAFMEVEGVIITVNGRILTGDSVLMDLNYTLKNRGGKLLGFYATLNDSAVILN